MTDAAASPFLNLPLRSEREAQLAREQSERERQRRLERHGAAFCRQILDGAYERIDQPDGGYRLRHVATGKWIEEEAVPGNRTQETAERPSSAFNIAQVAAASPIVVPETVVAACRFGYRAALRDVARWISTAAIESDMHADTLAALTAQITVLADFAARRIEQEMELR